MAEEKRSLHLKLQEYCDCFLETDPKDELELISKRGAASDITGNSEEVALKFLGVAILYALKESAKKISLAKTEQGEVTLSVEATGKYVLPAPSADLAGQVFKVMRSITHLEEKKGKELFSLGIKNDRIELGVEFYDTKDKELLTVVFPSA